MAKVYDCFTFFNELDLLEIRLQELYDVVDHFVIVEATRTFQKKEKPLHYFENRQRFKKFADKIIHVVVDTFPTFFSKLRVPRTWDYENSQREFILKGLENASSDDMVIVSDVDEIPLRSFVEQHKASAKPCVFEQYLCFYYLNNICRFYGHGNNDLNRDDFGFWRGPVMLRKKLIKTVKATRLLRDRKEPEVHILPKSGWHFSFLGGTDHIVKKIESFSHTEFNNPKYKDRSYIESAVRSGKSIFDPNTRFQLVDLGDSRYEFPQALVENPQKYSHLILNPVEVS